VLDDLYVDQIKVEREQDAPTARRRVRTTPGWVEGEFLRNRIPLSWLGRACELPGKALATGLAIWFLSGLRGGRMDSLKLTSATLERFGVSRSAKSRALKALEKAGLINVRREPRKNPLVTILDVPPAGQDQANA
jgi:DNA-binding transcriptional ArsR family regulator